jgi:uncharacterized protein YndB with AHSA1/START domain
MSKKVKIKSKKTEKSVSAKKPIAKAKSKSSAKNAKSTTKLKVAKVIKPAKNLKIKKTEKIVKGKEKKVKKELKLVSKPKVVVKTKAPKVPAAKVETKKEAKKIVTKPIDAIISKKKEEPFKSPKRKGGRKPKNKGDDDEPEIVDDILVEQLINSTKKLRQPKKPKFIQTFVNPMTSLTVATIDSKKSKTPAKEPKGKFTLEYVVRTSAGILYEFLTTPSGLAEWFADDVNIHDGIFTFFWDGSEQKARLLGFKNEQYIRFQWLDKPDGSFFEFRIQLDDLTGDVSLMVTDFADESSDLETSRRLWDSQVDRLLHIIGSY